MGSPSSAGVKSEHVEIGKQSPLKQEWKSFLKSSSLFVRTRFKNSVPTSFGTLVKKIIK